MELREGYKQTEVGMIPEDWDCVPMGEVGQSLIGLTYSPSNVKEYGTLVLRSSNVQGGQLAFENNVFVDMDLPKRVMVKPDDILICVRNGSRQLIGKCALIDERAKGAAFGAFMSVYRSKYPKFMFYQFQSNATQKQIEEVMGATINQITNKDFSVFKVAIPTDENEQTAIANALSDADALIQSLTRLIAKKRKIKQGAMQTLLTGKVRLDEFGKGDGYKKTDVGLCPKDWEIYTIPELMIQGNQSIKIGPFGSALKKELLCREGYKVYGQENVYEKDMSLGGRYINQEHYLKLKTCEILTGDFLISMMGTVGKCHIVPEVFEAGIMDSHLLRLRIDNRKLYPSLLLHLFQTPIVFNQIRKLSVGGIMEGLSSKIIKQIQLALPPVVEQMKIAEVLDEMDSDILIFETKLTKYKKIKQGMMQSLLTGRIRLVKPEGKTGVAA